MRLCRAGPLSDTCRREGWARSDARRWMILEADSGLLSRPRNDEHDDDRRDDGANAVDLVGAGK
jgi:hypothetical protein